MRSRLRRGRRSGRGEPGEDPAEQSDDRRDDAADDRVAGELRPAGHAVELLALEDLAVGDERPLELGLAPGRPGAGIAASSGRKTGMPVIESPLLQPDQALPVARRPAAARWSGRRPRGVDRARAASTCRPWPCQAVAFSQSASSAAAGGSIRTVASTVRSGAGATSLERDARLDPARPARSAARSRRPRRSASRPATATAGRGSRASTGRARAASARRSRDEGADQRRRDGGDDRREQRLADQHRLPRRSASRRATTRTRRRSRPCRSATPASAPKA